MTDWTPAKRDAQRRYRAKGLGKERDSRYMTSDKGQENQARRRTRDTKKVAARNSLWSAVRSGIVKRKGCAVCGKKAQAHHSNYSKATSVKWLCSKHHGR